MIKNILVTGELGLLGKPLVTFLKKKKYNVFVLDRSKNKKKIGWSKVGILILFMEIIKTKIFLKKQLEIDK